MHAAAHHSPARRVLDLVLERPPTLGSARLLVIDGPAGSGKTTLAGAVADLATGAVVVHTDDLLDGWEGLPGLPQLLDDVLEPLAHDRPGRYRRYDWEREAYAETVEVPTSPLLVLEGVGAGSRRHAGRHTALAWVEVDPATRLARGLARDGAHLREPWERWMRDEQAHFAAERTEARADLRLRPGSGASVARGAGVVEEGA